MIEAQRRVRVTDWLAELPAPVAVTYEAGPTGSGSGVRLPRRRNFNGHREIG